MLVYLIILAGLCFWGLKFSRFREDYLGKDQTDALKGIFVVLILFSHIRAHISLEGIGDQLYSAVFTRLGQMTVVPFFFYSGYGIIQGVQKKSNYVDRFFQNRILKFLIGYNIVSVVLGIIYFCLGNIYPLQNYLLAWSGWKSVYGVTGDGAWYVFVLLILYLITFAALQIFKKLRTKNEKSYLVAVLIAVFMLSVAFMAVMYVVKTEKEDYWFNTLMSYSFGMLYAVCKEQIDRAMKKNWAWLLALGGIVLCVGVIFISGLKDAVTYSIMGFLFISFVTLVTMRARIVNPVFKWIGGVSFGVYILQRSFMLLFQDFGINKYRVLYTALCIAATLLASWLHQWLSGKLSGLLLGTSKKTNV